MIEQEIRDLIEKNLPAQVGNVLRERLETAEKDAKTVTGLNLDIKRLQNENRVLNSRLAKQEAVEAREAGVTDREKVAAHREALIDLKEAHAKDKVAMMKSVVDSVFANNKYKYQESGTVPVVADGWPQIQPTSKTVESEG